MTDMHEMMSVDPPSVTDGGRKLTRGEKSKIAAKGRRDKEHIAMLDLMNELPVSMDILEKMDKAAVVKLATYYIKMKHFIQKDLTLYGFKALPNVKESAHGIGPNSVTKFQDQPTNLPESQMMLEALNGFLIFVSKKGTVKFVSNTVRDHLGHKQETLFGKSVYDFIHPNDHHELSKQFEDDQKNSNIKLSTMFLPVDEPRRVFYVRMKFSLTKPNSKVKNTGYMLVQWSGKMKRHVSTKLGCLVNLGLICICRPMQTTPLLEIRMDGSMFMSRHDLGMTFTFCDSRIITLIGYEPNELLGKTAYHFHNPIDAPKVQACHQNLIVKGTSVSKYYRFLGKNDNWVWLQTRATIIYNTANVAQYIVCMNFVISEEEGEKYLMLEEHQQANQHSANCVITLPDNPRSLTDCSTVKYNGGVKIVELQDENLEKTACLNGELDTQPKQIPTSTPLAPLSGGSQTLPTVTNTMVPPETGYQANLMVPVPSPSQKGSAVSTLAGSQCMTPTGFEPVSQCQTMIPEQNLLAQHSPMMSCGSNDNIGLTNETTNRIDPLVPDYMSHGSPESACSAYTGSPQPQPYTGTTHLSHTGSLCGNGLIDRTMDNFSQTMGASCSSSHSDDAGYESANSPYTASYLSPQTVSPACSYDSSDRGYTPDITNHSVLNQGQGQTCSYGGGFMMDTINVNDGLLAGHQPMDDSNSDYSNPVLDEIFKSMNQPNSDNLSVNMALVFSTIESLTSPSPLSVSTKVKSPGSPSTSNGSKSSSASVSQSERRTDKPLLRSFLTMPQDDIPKQPLGFLQMCKNNGQGKKSVNKNNQPIPFGMDKQMNASAQKTQNMNQMCSNMSVPRATVSNTVPNNSSSGYSETIDSEQLDLTAFPDEFQDFALQNLVNDITDAQAQALIADLQNEVGDTLMDTSEYFDTLDDTCTNTNTASGNLHNFPSNGVGSVSSSCVSSTIPFSQCKTSMNSTTSTDRNKCPTTNTIPQMKHSDPCFSNGPIYPVNSRPSKSAHDHVYHQSLSRLNGQSRQKFNNKSPENRAQFANNRLNGRQIPKMCQSQSQTSDHCKSELERHLRNRLKSRGQNCFGSHTMYNNDDKPFLQQLLTGELTNDMYIMMEKRRFEEKPIRPQ
ncbi:response to hypoxia [Mactra antiquata]